MLEVTLPSNYFEQIWQLQEDKYIGSYLTNYDIKKFLNF